MSVTISKGRGSSRHTQEILQRYADIIESSNDAIIAKTPSGIITDWNPAAERIFGYGAEEVIGKSILVLFPPDKLNEEVEILGHVSRGERIESYETSRIRKDGRIIDVSVSIAPIRDSSGRVIGASKIARDITEQKWMREQLSESEKLYKKTMDSLLEGCQIIGSDDRILYLNQAAARLYGRTVSSLLGTSVAELLSGGENEDLISAIRSCLRNRVPGKLDWDFKTTSRARYRLSFEPVPAGVFILSMDISE